MNLIYPVKFVGITQGYSSSHKAIDMGWNTSYGGMNHEIIAPEDGTIIYVKNDYIKTDTEYVNYGNYIKIDHGGGIVTLHAHLKYDSARVKVGDTVKKGDVIALMGNTGYSKGTHLHYEVIINGEKVNPIEWTYATKEHHVTDNSRNSYNILDLKEEVKEEESVNDEVINKNNIIFKYVVPKTGIYQIELNEKEKLVIVDV